MKLKIEFINGEERIIEDTRAHDFKLMSAKIIQQSLVLISETEAYPTRMIVKMEKVDET